MRIPRVSRRLLLGYLVLHLFAAGIFVLVLTQLVRNQMLRDARSQMRAMTTMLAEHIRELDGGMDSAGLPKHVELIGKKTQMRFTLIAADGVVIADSDTGTRDIGLHGTREEVLAASRDGVGFSQRHSNTLNKSMMYLARKYTSTQTDQTDRSESQSDGAAEELEGGFVRVAFPTASIDESVEAVQSYVWTFAIILGAFTAIAMMFLASRFLRPLALFSDTARKIGEGVYEGMPKIHHQEDEWGELAEAFQQMQSELRRRESRLVENSQRLEAVLSSMIEGVLALKPNGEVMLANGAACRMLSIEREKLQGRMLDEVVRIPELWQAVQKSQRDRTFSKAEFKTIGDSSRTLKVRVSMLADEEKPGVAVVLHDVTELRQLETMRQDFVANVSHELKTPLASIKAYAETLRMGALHDENKNVQFLEQIEFQADTLNQQIQDLLQLARVESGEKTFSISDIDVNLICETLHRQFLDAALGRHLELHLQLDQPSPMARCDVEAIETVVKNLVINAIHYTPEGGRVSISTKAEGRWVVVSVADTGIGIAKEQQARVFERFYRVDKARSRDMGGTGLGLAIVKHLTQAFGGSVTLDSQLGKGSKFHVRLPRSRNVDAV
ncbi:HAMP domain-containing sensor histidine kinase [Mariniblastus fucicola]|uniref:histidine kinase n=1 Tax=Mariniblastus fucicola TaxID=980251 RepID=A0A5B9PA70_9BACT|nr:HAMP domain-containing sensor histidine kinase [Mariniblastus fucicola]QEG22125.1 Alkaline phosphatase synthesis sensor protein PhoR [Mariniblastus fucicola]